MITYQISKGLSSGQGSLFICATTQNKKKRMRDLCKKLREKLLELLMVESLYNATIIMNFAVNCHIHIIRINLFTIQWALINREADLSFEAYYCTLQFWNLNIEYINLAYLHLYASLYSIRIQLSAVTVRTK